MQLLAADPRVVFIGQGVGCGGTFMSRSFDGIPAEKRIEMPVAEEMQMGMAIGLGLAGFVPVTVYPRFNFLLLAMNALVNHLDKLPKYRPKVIIRVGVGSTQPLDPGPQHTGDFTDAMRMLCRRVEFIRLKHAWTIRSAYQMALERDDGRPTALVEYPEWYDSK